MEAYAEHIVVARQVYIKAKDLDDFGLTRGCPRCDHQLQYGSGRASKPHSATCRARINGELAKIEAGRSHIANASEGFDRTVGEFGEQSRQDAPGGECK